MPITPQQLATVLQRAANLRRDVKRARITPADDDDGILLVDVVFYTDGRRVQREAAVAKCLDGRTCGQTLADWLGEHPAATSLDEADAIRRQRFRYLNHTPAETHYLNKHERVDLPPPAPRSRLDWNKAEPGAAPVDTPPAIPEAATPAGQAAPPADDRYYYTDPATQERLPKLTRKQMADMGLNREQRHAQYRIQAGRHPDDQ